MTLGRLDLQSLEADARRFLPQNVEFSAEWTYLRKISPSGTRDEQVWRPNAEDQHALNNLSVPRCQKIVPELAALFWVELKG